MSAAGDGGSGTSKKMKITVFKEEMTMFKLDPAKFDAEVMKALMNLQFVSITKTKDEISVIIPTADMEPMRVLWTTWFEGWRIMRIEEVLQFTMIGVLASIAEPFKTGKIPFLVVGTYDTDYFLVNQVYLQLAIEAINKTEGFEVLEEEVTLFG